MKNRINSRSLAAINRSLAAVGESVDRHSFIEPVQPVVEHDEVSAINRSLERLGDVEIAAEDLRPVAELDEVAAVNRSLVLYGEAVDNAFFEPDGCRFGGHGLPNRAFALVQHEGIGHGQRGLGEGYFNEADADLCGVNKGSLPAPRALSELLERMLGDAQGKKGPMIGDHAHEVSGPLPDFEVVGVAMPRLPNGFPQFDMDAHRARMYGELFADCNAVEVAAVNRSLERLDDGVDQLEPKSSDRRFSGLDLDNQLARPSSADYNRRFWDGNVDSFDDLGDDERDAMNRVLCLVGEEI